MRPEPTRRGLQYFLDKDLRSLLRLKLRSSSSSVVAVKNVALQVNVAFRHLLVRETPHHLLENKIEE